MQGCPPALVVCRQPRGKVEVVADVGVPEAGDGRYRVSLHRENHQAVKLVPAILGIGDVGRGRRLAIRARGDETDLLGVPISGSGGQKIDDRGTSSEPRRYRRHREHCILLEQCREAVEIGAIPGLDEAGEKLLLHVVRKLVHVTQRSIVRKPSSKRRASSLQGAVDACDRSIESIGYVFRAPAENIAQDESRPLPWWEELYCSDERERDVLLADNVRFGITNRV